MNNNQSTQYVHNYKPIKLGKKGKVEEPKAVKVPGLARQAIAKGFGKFIAGIKAVPNFVTNTIPNVIADKAIGVADKITDTAYASRANRIEDINRQISNTNDVINQNVNLVNQFKAEPSKETLTAEGLIDLSDINDVREYIKNLSIEVESLRDTKKKLEKGTFWFNAFFGHKEKNAPVSENGNTQAEGADQGPIIGSTQSAGSPTEPSIDNTQSQTGATEIPSNPIGTLKVDESKQGNVVSNESGFVPEEVVERVRDIMGLEPQNKALTQENINLKDQLAVSNQENEQLSIANKDANDKLSEQMKINGDQARMIAATKQELDKKDIELHNIITSHEKEIDDMKRELDKYRLENGEVAKVREELAKVMAERDDYLGQLVLIARTIGTKKPEQAEVSRTM